MIVWRQKRSARGPRAGGTRGGFSLVEVLIAVGVLMVAILSSVSSQMTSLNLMATSREGSLAMSDLQAVMESLLLELPDDIPAADFFPPNVSVADYDGRNLQDERIVPSYPGYVAGGAVPDPLPIVLTINWTDFGGRPRTLTLSSMKTR